MAMYPLYWSEKCPDFFKFINKKSQCNFQELSLEGTLEYYIGLLCNNSYYQKNPCVVFPQTQILIQKD